jgi:short-subunit dehydrogenase involved in D-alanine esterification of teichoic acids
VRRCQGPGYHGKPRRSTSVWLHADARYSNLNILINCAGFVKQLMQNWPGIVAEKQWNMIRKTASKQAMVVEL